MTEKGAMMEEARDRVVPLPRESGLGGGADVEGGF
jgi:hypothetical protein